ncbi:MAG TPA: Xaa-Pro aminopeptidase, partial [Clostridiales bacterium]|nr:Xaa-Pro aminopeptidase [Clostridiales bacterium]
MIKTPEEIALLEQAIALTGRGIAALQAQIRPGVMEYQLWSLFNHTLALEGCLEPAFPSIVAAGENVFCLHYMLPRTRLQAGDILQIDVGATAGGMC